MGAYIQFTGKDGSTVLVEVEEEEVVPPPGVVKAGLRETAQRAMAQAQESFDDALGKTVLHNADVLMEAMEHVAKTPETVEATFGLKATGELGNFAIAKAGSEANYTIKLVWKPAGVRAVGSG